jgi:uncharacterized membrane protein YccC
MPRTTIGERLVSAAAGAFFGAILGGAAAWIVGVYSNRLGPGAIAINGLHWIVGSAVVFAVAGMLFGSRAGTLVGYAIAAIFEFESPGESSREWHAPRWLAVAVLLGVALGMWLWFKA